MREIIFRGRDIMSGEWVYGDLYQERHSDGTIKTTIVQPLSVYKVYNVDPETVGQYTGLTDKNGTKIFEGDIVGHPLSGTKGIVRYMDFEFVVHEPKHDKYGNYYYQLYNGTKKATVIGNIHDNPEMIAV